MLNEEQNSTVLTEIQTGENHVSPEVEENIEKISTEKTDIVVEENVEENINSENSSAPENLSSSFSKTDNLTEKEELETEVENTILPNIYNGIISEDYADKLIRLGDLYAKNKDNEEAPLYLRYYHFMIARYVLEKKYETTKAEADLSALNTFDTKYEAAKEEYNKVRDNSLPLEIRLVRDYIEFANSVSIGITGGDKDRAVTVSIGRKDTEQEESKLFFFPESDFYGELDKIELKAFEPIEFNFNYTYSPDSFVTGVKVRNGYVVFTNILENDTEDIFAIKKNAVIVYGNVSSYVLKNFDDILYNILNPSTGKYYSPEMEELVQEFNSVILPNIYLGIYNVDYALKLIRLGDLCAYNSQIVENASYLQYYYYMLARYIIENKYEEFNSKGNFKYLDNFNKKYKEVKRRYQRLRDNSMPKNIRLVKDFAESCRNIITISDDGYALNIVFRANTINNIFKNSNLFFFPESDFYGKINSIRIDFVEPLKASEAFKSADNGGHYVEIEDNYIRIFRNRIKLLVIGNIESITVNVNGEITKCTQESYSLINFQDGQKEKDEVSQLSAGDMFRSWSKFKTFLKDEPKRKELDWLLLYLLYLTIKYDNNIIPVSMIANMYKQSKRDTGNRIMMMTYKLKKCAMKDYIDYSYPYTNFKEHGREYIIKKYIDMTQEQFQSAIDIHKAYLEKEEFKVCNHPTCKTWEEFKEIIDWDEQMTAKIRYLLYLYYLMQKYCATEIPCKAVNLFFKDNEDFDPQKKGTVSTVLKKCLNSIILCSENEEYSFTDKGKEYIRSLLICKN